MIYLRVSNTRDPKGTMFTSNHRGPCCFAAVGINDLIRGAINGSPECLICPTRFLRQRWECLRHLTSMCQRLLVSERDRGSVIVVQIELLLQRKICESSTVTLFPLLTKELTVDEIVLGRESWHS